MYSTLEEGERVETELLILLNAGVGADDALNIPAALDTVLFFTIGFVVTGVVRRSLTVVNRMVVLLVVPTVLAEVRCFAVADAALTTLAAVPCVVVVVSVAVPESDRCQYRIN
jgi:hypothetical protein